MNNRERDRKQIIELVDRALEEMGSASCNDWSIVNTEENAAWVEELYQYGVKNEIIDDGTKPQYYPTNIFWYDFVVAEITKHRYFAENS